jgi:CheY-like chemotaxis protein
MTTVLVIDDSIDYLNTLSQMFDSVGYDTVLTAEPTRALRLCDDIHFDLILCALELREARSSQCLSTKVGVTTLANLRKKNPHVPIVATGTVLSETMISEIGRLGIREAMPRTLPEEDVLRNIMRLLGGATA